MGRDPDSAVALYADDATYQVTPFDEPLRGRACHCRKGCGSMVGLVRHRAAGP
jgi:hypothetical protein